MKNLNDLIARLKEADGKRTQGLFAYDKNAEWLRVLKKDGVTWGPVIADFRPSDFKTYPDLDSKQQKENADFITLAANSMPEIIQALETQSKVIEKMREALERAKNEFWNKCYEGSGNVRSISVNEFDSFIESTIKECEALEDGNGTK